MGDPGIVVQFPVGERDLFLLHSVQKGSEIRSDSCLMDTGDSFPLGVKGIILFL
jgi:hypothetical protein